MYCCICKIHKITILLLLLISLSFGKQPPTSLLHSSSSLSRLTQTQNDSSTTIPPTTSPTIAVTENPTSSYNSYVPSLVPTSSLTTSITLEEISEPPSIFTLYGINALLYSNFLTGGSNVYIRNFVSLQRRTISIQLTYYGEGYLSFAFSNSSSLIPAIAVIGLPNNNTVLKYNMTGYTVQDIIPLPKEYQSNLTETSIQQTYIESSIVTILSFTLPLDELDVTSSSTQRASTNRFIWSVGAGNDLGRHDFGGSDILELHYSNEETQVTYPSSQSSSSSSPTSLVIGIENKPTEDIQTYSPPITTNQTNNCHFVSDDDGIDISPDGVFRIRNVVSVANMTIYFQLISTSDKYVIFGVTSSINIRPTTVSMGTVQQDELIVFSEGYDYITSSLYDNTTISIIDGPYTNKTVWQTSDGAKVYEFSRPLFEPYGQDQFTWAAAYRNNLGLHEKVGPIDLDPLNYCNDNGHILFNEPSTSSVGNPTIPAMIRPPISTPSGINPTILEVLPTQISPPMGITRPIEYSPTSQVPSEPSRRTSTPTPPPPPTGTSSPYTVRTPSATGLDFNPSNSPMFSPSLKPTLRKQETGNIDANVNIEVDPSSSTDDDTYSDSLTMYDETDTPMCASRSCDGIYVRMSTTDDSKYIHVELTSVNYRQRNDGYLGLALSPRGEMKGSIAIVGSSDRPIPIKYDLTGYSISDITPVPNNRQTLEDATYQQNATHSVLTFKKLIDDPDEPSIMLSGDAMFLYAIGAQAAIGGHGKARGSFTCNPLLGCDVGFIKKKQKSKRVAWLVHGILMILAWAAVMPSTVGVAMFRQLLPPGRLWYKIHTTASYVGFLLTFVAFFIAVVTMQQDRKSHFTTNSHNKAGLVIFLLMIFFQMVNGLYEYIVQMPSTPLLKPETGIETESHTEEVTNNEEDVSGDAVALGETKGYHDSCVNIVEMEEAKEKADSSINIQEMREAKEKDDSCINIVEMREAKENNDSCINIVEMGEAKEEDCSINIDLFETNVDSTTSTSVEDGQGGDVSSVRANTIETTTKKTWIALAWKVFHRIFGLSLIITSCYVCHTGCKIYDARYNVKYLIVCLYTLIAIWGVIAIQLGLVILVVKFSNNN